MAPSSVRIPGKEGSMTGRIEFQKQMKQMAAAYDASQRRGASVINCCQTHCNPFIRRFSSWIGGYTVE